MAKNRLSKLKALQNQMPIADSKTARQVEEARQIQRQAQLGQIGAGGLTARQQQQATQQAEAQEQQAQTEQVARQQQQSAQIAEAGIAEKASQAKQRLAEQELKLQEKQREYREKLHNLGEGAADKLLDQQLRFRQDQAGRTLFNERQLADFKVQEAKSQAEYEKWAQAAEHAHKRKLQMLETAYKKLETIAQGKHAKGQQELDQKTRMKIKKQAQVMKKKIQEERNEAANKMSNWKTAGTVFGGVAGGIGGSVIPGIGTAAGAAGGATIGGGLGTAAGGATS